MEAIAREVSIIVDVHGAIKDSEEDFEKAEELAKQYVKDLGILENLESKGLEYDNTEYNDFDGEIYSCIVTFVNHGN